MDITKEDFFTGLALGFCLWQTVKPLIILPYEPIPLQPLPISNLHDFVLRSAPTLTPTGIGNMKFEGEDLIVNNYAGSSVVALRTTRQNVFDARFVLKALSPGRMSVEVWNAYPWRLGRSCLVYFQGGKALKANYGTVDETLCDVDIGKDFVEVGMGLRFDDGECEIRVDSKTFICRLYDEPIGDADYCQINVHLDGFVRVAIREMGLS